MSHFRIPGRFKFPVTQSEWRVLIGAFTGDSGSGGSIGLVPAPAAGDAAAGKFLKADSTWSVPAGGGSSASPPNLLINPQFTVCQRNSSTETTTSDNAYWADRWRYIGEASAALTALDTTVGGGRLNGKLKLTGTTDKGGIAQIVEGRNCRHLRSAAVVFSAVLSVSNTRLGNIKMGIAEFTGTEDSVSGDPISSWGADGTTPTLAASWSWLNTPANLSVTTTPTTYSVTATCGASMNNLAVVIWNDDKSYTANDSLYFTDCHLGRGSSAPTNFEPRQASLEKDLCKRYFEKKGGVALYETFAYSGAVVSSTGAFYVVEYYEKRTAPTLTFATASKYQIVSAANLAGINVATIGSSGEGLTTAFLAITVASGLTAGQAALLRNNNDLGGFITIGAEL